MRKLNNLPGTFASADARSALLGFGARDAFFVHRKHRPRSTPLTQAEPVEVGIYEDWKRLAI